MFGLMKHGLSSHRNCMMYLGASSAADMDIVSDGASMGWSKCGDTKAKVVVFQFFKIVDKWLDCHEEATK